MQQGFVFRHFGRGSVTAAALAVAMSAVALNSAWAQSQPDTEGGRYTLSPVADGFLRLDTRSGVVSTCVDRGGWICRVAPDERSALDAEIGKLQAENQKLKEQLAQRDSSAPGKTDAPLAKEDRKKSAEAVPGKKFELQLPADHDKLMAMIDRMWDRLVEMASRLQKKLSEKI